MVRPAGESDMHPYEAVSWINLHVSTKLITHRRQHLFGKGMLLPGAKTGEQGGSQNFCGNSFLDCSLDRPSALSRVLNHSSEFCQLRIFSQRHGGQIEQPGTDDTPTSPELRYISRIEIVSESLRQSLRRGAPQNIEPLGIGLHHSIFDPVVDHFN